MFLCTQNIDNLHERAGSRQVVHMHGELLKARCLQCEAVEPWECDLSRRHACPSCRTVGGLRPHVVWFGEIPLHMDDIHYALHTADMFVAIGEGRSDSGVGPRLVRVGTHALKSSSTTTLWQRLAQHRGNAGNFGGNHRGSIFRQIVGTALITRDGHKCPSWGQGNSANTEVKAAELPLEQHVSRVIGTMPFLWLAIDDAPGPDSRRGYIERNTIALLSNFNKQSLDTPSAKWLGHHCSRERVKKSGQWNCNHVDENYDPKFLDYFKGLIHQQRELK